MSSRWRERFEDKVINSGLVRQLVYERWFRVVFAILVLVALAGVLLIVRIWRVTPPEVQPPIRLNGLNFFKSWSLQRSARKAMAEGDAEKAFYCWNVAIANHPANVELQREVLRFLIDSRMTTIKHLPFGVSQAMNLMRLTRTNQADLELAAQLYERGRLYDWLIDVLFPREHDLSPVLGGVYVKALFHLEQMPEVGKHLERLGAHVDADPELRIYRAAHQTGWGPAATLGEARRALEAAVADAEHQVLARRLRLAVAAQLSDGAGYLEDLQWLEQQREDTLLDHAGYWRLLVALGRREEAKQLAQAFPNPPQFALEAIKLAQVFVALGMTDYAHEFLLRYAPQFGFASQLWLLHADLLLDHRRWDELRTLAVRMRQHERLQSMLAGFAYYLEGRAELGQDRYSLAEAAFRKASEMPFENRRLGLTTAVNLLQLGFPEPGREILLKLESEFPSNPVFWHTLCLTAFRARQAELMLRAAARAYALQPGNESFANNYAAALLLGRTRPQEAVRLTWEVLSRAPTSEGAKVNHAMALLLLDRIDEAARWLDQVRLDKVNDQERNSVDFAWYEVHWQRRDYEQARQVGGRLRRSLLFPAQLQWLDATLREMAAREEKKS